MATTLLRLGLWTVILVLILYVLRETYPNQPFAELIGDALLQQVLVVAALSLVAGIVLRVLGVGARAVVKNRCRVCRRPVATGAIYCREHLRNVLHEEEDRTHMTRLRR